MLKFMLPAGYRRQQPIRRPKLGPWIEVIDQIVKEDGTRPVPSRLIGEQVEARLYMDQVEVWYGQKKVGQMPRLRGRRKHRVDSDQLFSLPSAVLSEAFPIKASDNSGVIAS
jgi:hypothetical protein